MVSDSRRSLLARDVSIITHTADSRQSQASMLLDRPTRQLPTIGAAIAGEVAEQRRSIFLSIFLRLPNRIGMR